MALPQISRNVLSILKLPAWILVLILIANRLSSATVSLGVNSEKARACEEENAEASECASLVGLFQVDLRRWQSDVRFIHIPKSAGSSIEEVGNASSVQWGRFANWAGCGDIPADFAGTEDDVLEMPGGDFCNAWHVPPEVTEIKFQCDMYELSSNFCIVRHPYDRAVSEFLYSYDYRFSDDIAAKIDRHGGCSAESLNRVMREVILELQERPYMADCHFVPQAKYVYSSSGRQYCQNVLKFDSLPDGFNVFMAAKKLDVRLSDENRSNTHSINHPSECTGLSAADLTNETRALLDLYYHADFELLSRH